MNDTPLPRKRLKRFEIENGVRHLTFSCVERLPLFADPKLRDMFADQLFHVRARTGLELFAWVIMPEHVHLLLRPPLPDATVSHILSAIKRPVARRALSAIRTGQCSAVPYMPEKSTDAKFWQAGGGYDRNVRSTDDFHEKAVYIEQNPVRRGLVERPEDWDWSSARARSGIDAKWPLLDRAH